MPPGGTAAAEPTPPPSATVEDWVLATMAKAVAYASSLLRDRSTAEDVVQDCYYRLLRRAGEYDLPRDGTKLLYRAITNACINQAQRRRSWVSLAPGENEAGVVCADGQAAPPEAWAARNELAAALKIALAELPVDQRAAVELRSLGHSQAEVGEALGLTTTHAGVLIHRARHSLKLRLKDFLLEELA